MSAPTPREESLAYLKSIDASLKSLVSLAQRMVPAEPVDLDGPHGDPIVNAKDPRDWLGGPMKGRHFSQCPAAYLDLWAQRQDHFADKARDAHEVTTTGNPREPYIRNDAALARGWAARIRANGSTNTVATANQDVAFPSDMMKSDDISF